LKIASLGCDHDNLVQIMLNHATEASASATIRKPNVPCHWLQQQLTLNTFSTASLFDEHLSVPLVVLSFHQHVEGWDNGLLVTPVQSLVVLLPPASQMVGAAHRFTCQNWTG